MSDDLEKAFASASSRILDIDSLVRVVLSGRRRNMQTPTERIDIRPVDIKGELQYQVTSSDGRAMTAKNFSKNAFDPQSLLIAGFANFLIESVDGVLTLKVSKKDKVLSTFSPASLTPDRKHDREKKRLLKADDPFLRAIGISDHEGRIKPSKNDKYLQVEEFLRILVPTLTSAIDAGHITKPTADAPLTVVDLGCGHAYLTFAAHQYLMQEGIPVQVVGIDVRESSRKRNEEIAQSLGISQSISFRAEEIARTPSMQADVVIALHACDTATDDAIAWAVASHARLALLAPCCHHDIQAQMKEAPEPWGLITRHGIMKERLGDLITDALRMQILKLLGYRTEAIEFIGGEHTPRNLMIRATFTGSKPDAHERAMYDQMVDQWKVKPALTRLISTH